MADTGDWVTSAQQEIAAAPVEGFKKRCRDLREEFSSKVIRLPDAAKQNKAICSAELARFRADIEPELNRITQLLPPGYEGGQEAREEAALLLGGIASHFTWADAFIESEKLYEEALKLAQNTFGKLSGFRQPWKEFRSSAQQQRVFGKPISSVPALGSINGVGCTLYGQSDYHVESKVLCHNPLLYLFSCQFFRSGDIVSSV